MSDSSSDSPQKPRTLVSFDWAMKYLLRDKANFDILEGFLSALLGYDVTIRDILESESNQSRKDEAFNRVDLIAVDEKGELCVIELQYSWEKDYLQRLLYGASKLIVDHFNLGEDYSKVKKVISVSILYFSLGQQGNDYVYKGTNRFFGIHSGKELVPKTIRAVKPDSQTDSNENIGLQAAYSALTGQEIIAPLDVFPDYYLIEVSRFNDLVKEELDEWIYLFKNSSILPYFKSRNIQKAGTKLDLMKMDPKNRSEYEAYIHQKVHTKGLIESAKLEGELKGEMKGRIEGKIEGRVEGKIEVARSMKEKGFPPEMIAEITGLPLNEILEMG